jgi:hypothetical protein
MQSAKILALCQQIRAFGSQGLFMEVSIPQRVTPLRFSRLSGCHSTAYLGVVTVVSSMTASTTATLNQKLD